MRTAIFLVLALAAGCNNSGTYVVVDIARAPTAPSGIASIELDLTLGTQTATRTLADAGGAALQFPTSAVFTVDKSGGALTLVAIGRDVNGHELVRAGGSGDVTRGKTLTLSIDLGQHVGDGGAPGDGGTETLALAPATHDFGSSLVKSKGTSFSFSATNNGPTVSGPLVATLLGGDAASFTVSNDQCTGSALMPAASCPLTITFAPSSTGMKRATLQLTDGVDVLTAALTGSGLAPGALVIAPADSNDFGPSLLMTATAPVQFTITNSGGVATGPLAASVTGNDPGDFMPASDGCSTMKLAPQQSCTISVGFDPLGAGARSATLQVVGSPGGAVTASLSGTGLTVAALSVSQNAGYGFGTVDIGHSSDIQLTVSNGGSEATGMLTTTLSGDTGDFSVTDNCNQTTLAGNGSCTLTVTATPGSFGPKSLSIAVAGTPGGTASTTVTATGRDALLLTVVPAGNGSGTVTSPGGAAVSSGTGIDCGATCSDSFYRTTSNPSVTLTAAPSMGSAITGWSIAGCGTATTCDVTLSGSTQVTVTFGKLSYPLTITNTSIAGKTGVVTSVSTPTATEIDCPGTCTVNLLYGTTVVLTATPASGGYFGGWSGGCSGFSPTCNLTIGGATQATARFTPANVAFATSTQYSVDSIAALGTGSTNDAKMMSGADKACANAAAAQSLSGHFVALFSGSAAALTRLYSSPSGNSDPRGWLRRDGLPFTDSLGTLTSPIYDVLYPLYVSETGSTLPASTWSITGGGYGYIPDNCANWSSTSTSDVFGIGYVFAGSYDWAGSEGFNCSSTSAAEFSLLCFQTDYSAYVPPPGASSSARRIFVTSSGWDPSTGLSGADALCGQLAGNATLPGTYKALLPTPSASAASRFSARGVSVVRTDGVVVAATDTAIFASGFVPKALVTQTETGAGYGESYVRTGAVSDFSVVATAANTCSNWTSSSGSSGIGMAALGSSWLSSPYEDACASKTDGVYCLEQ